MKMVADNRMYLCNVQAERSPQFMSLENQLSAEDYAVIHFQNTLVDYHMQIGPLPEENHALAIEVGRAFRKSSF